MTREEAIDILQRAIAYESDFAEAKHMAIEALSEPKLYTHEEVWSDDDLISRADAHNAICGTCEENCKYEKEKTCYHAREHYLIDSVAPSADRPTISGYIADDKEVPSYTTTSAVSANKPIIEHDKEWIIGCIKHDGFIKTDRFDKANQIILDALADRPSVVKCKDCEYYNPPHIQHNDGTRTDYPKKMVSIDVGTNVGGQCENPFPKTYCTNHERENPNDLQNLVIFREPTDFCSFAKMKGGAE